MEKKLSSLTFISLLRSREVSSSLPYGGHNYCPAIRGDRVGHCPLVRVKEPKPSTAAVCVLVNNRLRKGKIFACARTWDLQSLLLLTNDPERDLLSSLRRLHPNPPCCTVDIYNGDVDHAS